MAALSAQQAVPGPSPAPADSLVVVGRFSDAPATDVERERARLEALHALDIMDTPQEEAFDRITRLAKKLFGVPIALVSFIDAHRQWYKSAEGTATKEVPREGSFCRHVIETRQCLVVSDATKDPRFASNPYVVGDPGIRFYAGAPLRTNDGHNIGTLCLIDTKPRDFDESQIELLSDLAEMAMDELELRICGRTDGLTGALTRRTFKEEARRAVALALRHHDDLSCIVFDFDLFKSVNDTSGYTTGDLVLAKVVEACARELRSTDLIGRLGGDKFVVLLPNTSTAGAARTAEKLRTAIGALSIDVAPDPISVTASFGIASLNTGARDADALLEHADKAAREAKAAGRNRCVTWHLPDEEADKGRRRVLKGGKILLNDRTSTIDCTVRSLSDTGAGIDVSSAVGVPRNFDLQIKADHFLKSCEIVSQDEKHLEVAFV